MQLEEKEWCELFGNSIEFTSSDRFSSDETEDIETGKSSKIPQWDGLKEVNKIVKWCFYQSNPTKWGYRKWMMKTEREIGLSVITQQRFGDQTSVIRTNGWLSKVQLD